MEKKYTLQDLAALLAERESLPLEQAEDFVRSFFELTEEGLLKDSFVKVTGVGTFKLVEVSERESVNINTGERFQISGHNKISFTPDGTLRELVNRPFAHFTTVTLNDKTPEAALEEAERPLAEESTESSATSSHTPLPAPAPPVASSPSYETNTTAPAEEEQQPDAATEKAEENVVPAVEETTFAPTSAHFTVTTEAPTPEVSAEQAHEEAKNNQSVSTAPAATATSSLLLRPTPAPIIDGALLVSQTPTPVLNNEQLSDLLSHTPDDTAATAENSDEEESNVPPVSHDTEEETNEKRFEENEVHETCVTTAEEEEETHEEEEETHEETTTLPEEDTPQHPTTYEEHTVDQPIDSAHQTPATEIVSTVAVPVLDLNLAEESTPESTTTSAEAAEQLVEAPASATEAAAPLSPASTEPTETESEKSAEEQESHGPALQFVPTREALRALADEHTEPEPEETPAIEPQLRDQFRIPVNIEIRHAEPKQEPVPAVTDEVPCANETPTEENEAPTLVGETSDEPSTNAVETAQTPAAANDDPSVSSLPTEETAEPAPSFAAPQLDLESLEAPTPVDAEEAETPVEDTPSAEAPLPGETPETESSATLSAEEEHETPEETTAGTEQLLTVAAPILTYPQSTAEEVCDSATQSATVDSPTAVNAVTSTTCTTEESLGKEVLTDSTEELPLELTPTGSVSTSVAEPQSVAASTAQTTAATAADENEVRESSSHHSRRRRHRSRRKKTPWGPIVGIILLVLLLLCCYFGYLCQTRRITAEDVPTWLQPLYQICAPEEDDGQNTHIGGNPSHNKTSQNGTQPADQRTALTKAKADSIATAEKAAAAQKAAEEKAAAERQARIDKIIARSKRYSQVEGGSFLIVGLHDKHKMKSGDNVYKLAERTFGDRSYAKYIIHFNNISNPDFIKVNEVLKIPELVNPKNIK